LLCNQPSKYSFPQTESARLVGENQHLARVLLAAEQEALTLRDDLDRLAEENTWGLLCGCVA
jgi:hypothetical protein